jgi:inhibitor of cysteine peptidase
MVFVSTLSLMACATASREVPFQLSADDFAKNKDQTLDISHAHIGDEIKITLPSNATTGFRWVLTGFSSEGVLAQDGDSEYVLPESTALGASGQEIWSFKTLKRGTTSIYLEYSQSWEGGAKKAWTFTAAVTVK